MTDLELLDKISLEDDYFNEYGLVGQFLHISLAIAKCSEPVSKMTLTGFDGVPTFKVPTYRLSGEAERLIFRVFSPEEALTAFILY